MWAVFRNVCNLISLLTRNEAANWRTTPSYTFTNVTPNSRGKQAFALCNVEVFSMSVIEILINQERYKRLRLVGCSQHTSGNRLVASHDLNLTSKCYTIKGVVATKVG